MNNADSSQIELIVSTSGEGYRGFVVIDSLVEGRSAGGVRISDELKVDEVSELAREMSFKFALFHLSRGGAKAGVELSADLDSEGRHRALRDFGRKISPLLVRGIYFPGMDMNCGPDELRSIYRGAGIELGEVTDTSFFTAISMFHCLEACAAILPTGGRRLRLAIEGFGSAARHLAERLDPARFEIAAVSTLAGAVHSDEGFDPQELSRRKLAEGDAFVLKLEGRRIEREELFTADVDILVPSSRIWVISQAIAAHISARLVLPIANAPYARGSLDILAAKNVVCLPGYMSNVGGVMASSLHDLGVSIADVERFFASEYRTVVDEILQVASRSGRSVTDVTTRLVELHMAVRKREPGGGRMKRLYDRLVAPRLPVSYRARQAGSEFSNRMRGIRAELRQMGSTA